MSALARSTPLRWMRYVVAPGLAFQVSTAVGAPEVPPWTAARPVGTGGIVPPLLGVVTVIGADGAELPRVRWRER